MYVCMYVCMCAYVCMCVCVYMYVCMCAYVCVYVCMYVCVCIITLPLYKIRKVKMNWETCVRHSSFFISEIECPG